MTIQRGPLTAQRLSVLLSGVMLSGCATVCRVPPGPAASSMPASALVVPVSHATDDVHAQLAQPASGPLHLTLDSAVARCLVVDPRIRAGLENLSQAEADAVTAALPPNPSLWSDLQLLPLTRPFTVTEQGGPPQFDTQLSYRIDWWLFGKQAAAIASAKCSQHVAAAEFEDLIRQRVLLCSLNYLDLVEAHALMALSRETHQELEALEQVVAKANMVGAAATPQLKKVQVERVKHRQSCRETESAHASARTRLATSLGLPPAGAELHPLDSLSMPPPPAMPPLAEALAKACQLRPDVEALRRRVAQAKADIEVENRRAYPEVTPTFGYTRQYQAKAIGFPDANSWSAAVDVTLPLFNRNEGNRARAVSVAAQAQLMLEAAELELQADVTALHTELAVNLAAAADAVQRMNLAMEWQQAAQRLHAEGKADGFDDVIESTLELQESRRAQLQRRAACWRAWWKFHAALGDRSLLR